ncbi:MAG: deoxynucleoside kinase [Flavobacteriales bacterium]|nr:deoxynucleoside kinase [Flavobacteriales bacterium]
MSARYSYIAIEGLIGAGKTTLARRLAERWNGRLVLEEFDDNPFLPRFYQEPERYAFSVELSFLAQRYHQLKRVTEQELFSTVTVADYSIGKSLVFANATLPPDEHALFRDLYQIMYADLPQPQLIVYLHLGIDRLRERIQTARPRLRAGHRGRLPHAPARALHGPSDESSLDPRPHRGPRRHGPAA